MNLLIVNHSSHSIVHLNNCRPYVASSLPFLRQIMLCIICARKGGLENEEEHLYESILFNEDINMHYITSSPTKCTNNLSKYQSVVEIQIDPVSHFEL